MPHPLHGLVAPATVALAIALLVAGCVYVRGCLRLRSTPASTPSAGRAAGFLLALVLVWVAVGSPLASLDHEWLTAHMAQHLLLMSVAAPLIWLGAPLLPMLRGLPRQVAAIARSLSGMQAVRRIRTVITQPTFCWLAATLTLTLWHVPSVMTMAMHSNTWHLVQHASFLVSGLLFWWPVIRPWPSARAGASWSIVVYLFLATLPCDALSAFLVFSERVAYPVYLVHSGGAAEAVLADQQCAGALMWTAVTIIYLTAATMVSMRLLAAQTPARDDRERVEAA